MEAEEQEPEKWWNQDKDEFISNVSPEEFADDPVEPTMWIPEDFGFKPTNPNGSIAFEKGNFQLIPKKFGFYLMRKRIKNERGNTEYLVKWYHKIEQSDTEWATLLFTKGLQ